MSSSTRRQVPSKSAMLMYSSVEWKFAMPVESVMARTPREAWMFASAPPPE